MRKKILETMLLISVFGFLGAVAFLNNGQNVKAELVQAKPIITKTIADKLSVTEVSRNNISIVTEEKPFEPYWMYSNCRVNVRESFSTESNVLDTIMPNVPVEVISVEGEWSQVKIDETFVGYIKSEYLSETETPVSELNRWGVSLTEDEIYLLSCIVYQEAHNQSLYGKEAVVEVVFNRMSMFEKDLYSVLSERHQFTTWHNRFDNEPTFEEFAAVYNVMYGTTWILPGDYIYFATYKANGTDFVQIGEHWFGRE